MQDQPQPPLLEMRGITKRFGAVTANDGIDLTLAAGEIVGLLGENGAGKTTLMNILFGAYDADVGIKATNSAIRTGTLSGGNLQKALLARELAWNPRILLAVQALLDVREKFKPHIDLQLVAFPQDGVLRSPGAMENLKRALDMGVDVVGGIPHFERTMDQGAESIRRLCELAAERGLLVDMHCDESDDPWSRHIETLTFQAQRLGLHGRVAGSHLTSMHSMDNYYVSKLLPLMAEARMHAVANPLINITLQGRHDTYPKRRGLTRVKEMLTAGINVAFGHDCVMDPWYSFGSHDMLEVAHMGLHVAQMTGTREIEQIFDAVTVNGARAMNLDGYGLTPGCRADMVELQAGSVFDAIRLRPARLHVIRRGKVIARTKPVVSRVVLENGPAVDVDFLL